MGRPFGPFWQKSEPENHRLWQKQTHKTERKRKHLQFLLEVPSFPSSPKADPEKPCTQSHPQSTHARKRPHRPVFSLTSVALVSPSAAVSVRSLSVCGSQRQSDPRRKQGQKTNPSGQTGHTLVEPFMFYFPGVGGTLPSHGGMGMSKAKKRQSLGSSAEPPPRSRPEAHAQWATLTCLHSLFGTSICHPTPFPLMPLKALLKKCLMQIEWRFIHTYFTLVMPH